jgi:hypothetical protein
MGENQGNAMKGTRPDPKVADPNKDVVSTLGQEDGQAGNQQSGGQQSGQQQQGNQQSGQQEMRQGGNADSQRANR